MKICGIIAEYNPFHNGHEYQLWEAKKLTGCDFVVVCMSGDFVQRGLPAIGDKYSRTKAALEAGADLVIELPTIYATASAEYFARGSVSILDKLGCDYLCFGSESGDIELIQNSAKVMQRAEEEYDDEILSFLKSGKSYAKALDDVISLHSEEFSEKYVINPESNDKLAICYVRALEMLESKIKPYAVKRTGSRYLDSEAGTGSAMAIRGKLKLCEDPWSIKDLIPDYSYDSLFEDENRTCPLYSNDFSDMMYMKIKELSSKRDARSKLSEYLDVSDNISGRIIKNLNRFSSVDRFASIIHSPEYTISRIYRSLLHIMLDIKEEDIREYLLDDDSFYARVIGFNKNSSELMSELKKRTRCPIISKVADCENVLSDNALSIIKKDIYAADLYEHVASRKFDRDFISEYERRLVII